jgi:hypothetical protein
VNWLKYRNYWMVAGVVVLLPVMAQGQTGAGSVTVKANVSETVALLVSPNSLQDNVRIEAQSDVKALTLTLSGSATDVATVRVPLLIRSIFVLFCPLGGAGRPSGTPHDRAASTPTSDNLLSTVAFL